MDEAKIKSIVESLLFVSGEPIKLARLAKICSLPKNEIETAISNLNIDYANGRGLRIITSKESVQLVTNPENEEFVSQMISGELNAELSKSALETLSIVAYKGPISRAQIEAIRGLNCSYVIRSLLMRGLLERKESVGVRGYLYEVTLDFLKNLGIENVNYLPDWKDLSINEKVDKLLEESDEKTEL
jgi:segregation and condensation protein B